MRKSLLIVALLAGASFKTAIAVEAVPVKRTTLPVVTFDEVLKQIALEITICKRLHGVMTKIASATMKSDKLVITGEASLNPIDSYPMKLTPTREQAESLKGKPICDPN